jgi:hypothetical protein
MKKLLILTAIFSLATFVAFAQNYNTSPQISFGLSPGIAVGSVSNVYPEAGNISAKFTYPFKGTPVSLTLKTGYTFYASNSGYDIGVGYGGFGYSYGSDSYGYGSVASFVPVTAGLKVYVANRFFIEGEAGVSFNVNTYPGDYTGKTTAFIYSPGAGYSFPLGYSRKQSLDLGLAYENRVEPGGGYEQIAIHAFFNFGL